MLPTVTAAPRGSVAVLEIATPEIEMSISRALISRPLSMRRVTAVWVGTSRSWERPSGRPRISRLASQVSWDAILSRLRGVALSWTAKPPSLWRAMTPSIRPICSR